VTVRAGVIERLYETHYEPLLRLAYLLAGASGAEDLVQDAFVRALDRWRPDAPEEAFRAWAQTTMVRLSASRWRRSSRERIAYERHGTMPDVAAPEVIPEVEGALAALTPRQRSATVLRYYEDLPDAAIAERMGVRVGTVKALLHQARERLRVEPALATR
jgi:RNA polymerase sigma factor (sigma-70 family)